MTTRNTRRVYRLLVTAALIYSFVAGAAQAEEKLKSIWVKADELLVQGKYAEAVKLYSIAIEINADDPDIYHAYYGRAESLLELHRVDEALADYTESLRLNPVFPNAYKRRGIVYLLTDRYAEALNDFSRFIELEADNASGYANRGIALEQLGIFEKALSDFNRSIELDPECAACFYNRYQLHKILGRDTEAALDLEKAQSLDSRYKGDK